MLKRAPEALVPEASANERLGLREKLSYGVADMGFNFYFGFISYRYDHMILKVLVSLLPNSKASFSNFLRLVLLSLLFSTELKYQLN